jgi:hypothetical protein
MQASLACPTKEPQHQINVNRTGTTAYLNKGLCILASLFQQPAKLTVRHKTVPYFKRVLASTDTWGG